MERLNREYSLNINDDVVVKYGCTNVVNPIVVYVQCKTWISPSFVGDYAECLGLCVKKLKHNLKNIIIHEKVLDDKLIFDFDLNFSTLQLNKKNFLCLEFLFKQNKNYTTSIKQLKPQIVELFGGVLNEFIEDLKKKSFSISKGKR